MKKWLRSVSTPRLFVVNCAGGWTANWVLFKFLPARVAGLSVLVVLAAWLGVIIWSGRWHEPVEY